MAKNRLVENDPCAQSGIARGLRTLIGAGLAAFVASLAVVDGGVAAERPVVIGALYNLTGGQQDLDVPSSRGARLAVDEANKAGGVLGRPVKLILRRRRDQTDVIARKTATLFKQQPAISPV